MNNYTNDDKSIDLDYKSPIVFLGERRELGRTNDLISNKIRRVMERMNGLDEFETDEEMEKEFSEIQSQLQKLIPKIITPINPEDIEYINAIDLEELLKSIMHRVYRRRGFSQKEIDDMEQKERDAIKRETFNRLELLSNEDALEDVKQVFLRTQIEENKKKQSMEEDTPIGKQNSLED